MSSPEAKLLLSGAKFLTEGGAQTALIYKHGRDLPEFSTHFMLYKTDDKKLLTSLRHKFIEKAIQHNVNLILDTETWRASANWLDKIGTDQHVRDTLHEEAVAFTKSNVQHFESTCAAGSKSCKAIAGATIGPAQDAYSAEQNVDLGAMRQYHSAQIAEFKRLGIGVAFAYTFNNVTEACAIAMEAKNVDLPVVISFTVNSMGKLAEGESIQQAVEHIDNLTNNSVLFFMLNCVHPAHIRTFLQDSQGEWLQRIRGVRGNASMKSHDELDGATEIDEGDPVKFAHDLVSLQDILPNMIVFGGCCGTDEAHCEQVAKLLVAGDS